MKARGWSKGHRAKARDVDMSAVATGISYPLGKKALAECSLTFYDDPSRYVDREQFVLTGFPHEMQKLYDQLGRMLKAHAERKEDDV